MSDPIGICGWLRLDGRLTSSGRLRAEDLPALRSAGVRALLNLAPDDHEKALPREAAAAAASGLRYFHIPVAWTNPTERDFALFCEAMAACATLPTHIHCIANKRVSAFLYRYRRDVLGDDEAAARADLHKIWKPDGIWADFIAPRP
ncbi:MAG: protein tyrosine phosphatase family protein [Hyphomonadaceae bacterium]